ncbi:phosphotransferase, partial [Kaarinaea lacus]
MTTNFNKEEKHAYDDLTPDTVLDAVESLGLMTNGRLLALNSYENRVYQIGIEDQRPVVAKFYRPDRWSNDAIIEEHQFTLALAESEIPVIPPMTLGEAPLTLHEHMGFRFAVYPNCGGRWPEL